MGMSLTQFANETQFRVSRICSLLGTAAGRDEIIVNKSPLSRTAWMSGAPKVEPRYKSLRT